MMYREIHNRLLAAATVMVLAAPGAPTSAAARDGGGAAVCAPRVVQQVITSTGLDPDATARARWRRDDRCGLRFDVEIEDVPAGDYDLLVDDVVRGVIHAVSTPSGVAGEIEFEAGDDQPHELPLDFAPLGAVVEIRGGGRTFFADTFDGAGTTVSSPTPTRTAAPTDRPTRSATETRTRTRTASPPPTATRTASSNAGPSSRSTATPTRTPTRRASMTPTRTPEVRDGAAEKELRGRVAEGQMRRRGEPEVRGRAGQGEVEVRGK